MSPCRFEHRKAPKWGRLSNGSHTLGHSCSPRGHRCFDTSHCLRTGLAVSSSRASLLSTGSSLLVFNLTESRHVLFLRMLCKGVSCHLACTVVYEKAGNDHQGHVCPVFINFVWFFFFGALRFSQACLAQASFGGGGWKVGALWRLQQLGFIKGMREQNGNI